MTEQEEHWIQLEETLILTAVRQWTSWCRTDINRVKVMPIFGDPTRKLTALDCLTELENSVTRSIQFYRTFRKNQRT